MTTSPASAQGWHDGDSETNRDLGDLLRDRIRTREDLRDFIADLLRDRPELRRRLRERLSNWRDRDDDDNDGGWRGGLRERIAGRIAERRQGEAEEGGECFFFTRSLRDEDGDFLVIIRRRICRD